ncbi:MAG: hypothetical protein J7K98_02895 [Candidatus Aenigmarchaeota archaeon]|nr:hypothetical protein [Candidatus Aenigmarchaeota archaeon]
MVRNTIKMSKKELERIKKKLIDERKKFIEMYVKWLKSQPIDAWSKQQKVIIDSQLKQLKKKK